MNFEVLAQHVTIATVVISLTVILQVSFNVKAYRLDELDALEALGQALENNDIYPLDNQPEYDVFKTSDTEFVPTEKRYARLSYYYGNKGRGSNSKYYNNRYYRSRYYENYYSPWKNLPDTECFREQCSSDSDCCRRFSKCDRSARVCYNCWYGHPCSTSRDCCERYPYCNKNAGGLCQS